MRINPISYTATSSCYLIQCSVQNNDGINHLLHWPVLNEWCYLQTAILWDQCCNRLKCSKVSGVSAGYGDGSHGALCWQVAAAKGKECFEQQLQQGTQIQWPLFRWRLLCMLNILLLFLTLTAWLFICMWSLAFYQNIFLWLWSLFQVRDVISMYVQLP